MRGVRLPGGPVPWLIAALAAASLGAAWALKAPCTTTPWDDHFQYRNYCYSDVLPLWFGKQLSEDAVQYVEVENEYPVLTGWFMWGVAKVTTDLEDYMVWSFLLLLLAGGLSTVALARLLPRELLLAWVLVPAVPLHGLTNWDLLAVAFACWGWHEWVKGRPTSSSLLFGLGGAAKLYPAFFLPFLFLAGVRAKDLRTTLKVALGGFLGLVVPNLVLAIWTPHGWWATYRFHLDRHPDFETPWQAFLDHFLRPIFPDYDWGTDWRILVGRITLVVLAATFAWMAWLLWRPLPARPAVKDPGGPASVPGLLNPLVAGGMFTLAFCLVNKVYSPQYTLWVVPVLLLMRAAWKPFIGFVAFDAVNFWVRYRLFTPPPGQSEGWNPAWDDWSLLAVNARWAFLAWATWTIVRRQGLVPRRAVPADLVFEAGPPARPAPAPEAPR